MSNFRIPSKSIAKIPKTKLVIVGAGGLGREMYALAKSRVLTWRDGHIVPADYEPLGFVISNPSKLTKYDTADLVRGDFDWLRTANFRQLIVAIGDSIVRARVVEQLEKMFPEPDRWATLLHWSIRFEWGTTKVGIGVMMRQNVAGTVNVHVGDHCCIGPNATMGHEASLGRCCVVNPGANISGNVSIGNAVMVGTGAQVLQRLTIGDGAVVGAGAVVTHDVPPGVTVVGVPARPMRRKE